MQITLYVPGLTPLCAKYSLRQELPALETLFVRSRAQPALDDRAIVAGIFNLAVTEFSPAPFMRLADTGLRDSGFYFCADPVHLAPDRDQLVMLPLSVMQVQMAEAAGLAETFNHMYEADGYRLETPNTLRWYLRCPAALNCITQEPAKVEGQAVFDFMPSGEHGMRLRQLMNEVQMLFFEHPVNQEREAAGKPAINSLWLWGGGCLPEKPIQGPERVVTDLPALVGLARYAGSDCISWPSHLVFPTDSERMLVGIKLENETEMRLLEEQFAAPVFRALQLGQVNELNIYPGNQQRYRITRSSLRRFWRRRRYLSEILGIK